MEDTPKRLVFDITGAGHTLCNALKSRLWSDKAVKVAAYAISHPLVGKPRFVLETDGEKPSKVLSTALSKLADIASAAKKEFKKIKS